MEYIEDDPTGPGGGWRLERVVEGGFVFVSFSFLFLSFEFESQEEKKFFLK